jgi:polyhydroxyalkanoate synthesis regulator phasin
MATADELTEALDAFYERSIRPEFDRLGKRMEERFRVQANDRLADLYGKFQGLQDEYHLIANALRHLEEEGIPTQRVEMDKLAGRLDQVERRLAAVEAKLGQSGDR